MEALVRLILIAGVCCSLGALWYTRRKRTVIYPDLPFASLDDKEVGDPDVCRMQFMADCNGLLKKGSEKFNGPFQVYTGDGRRIVLPNSFADEIRDNENMSFGESAIEGTFNTLSGFEPFGLAVHQGVMRDVVRLKLTRSLDAITPELRDEARQSVDIILGKDQEWKEMSLKDINARLIARLSSRIFFGAGVSNNDEYLDATISYTMDSFMAHRILRTWKPWLRPFVHWFIPECQRVRQLRKTIRDIISPVIKQQEQERRNRSDTKVKVSDMLGWLEEIASRKNTTVPVADAQLFLAFAAIHTTTENLTYVLLDIVDCPGLIDRLRDEIVEVLSTHTWTKTTFGQMKLLDSVLKESQRLHPVSAIMMERKVLAPVTLSNGLTLPAGSDTFLDTLVHRSPEIYPDADKFIPDRFMKLREIDTVANSKWQFVSTSAQHLGFGHGRNSCPGRFFASNELKIALVYLLIGYDWKYPEGGRVPEMRMGQGAWVPAEQKIMFKRTAGANDSLL
ncbi:hypothetical protein H2204_002209 [Knufia peltigerae]|uniref:Cytochrome P450 n=1 Tax=Knufia peltigerae TaxID=1002370 RepID=A0AA39D3C2_9EURO|nr:hypothetical protein H2204_002209 [Knufia peltigerae]